MPQNDSVFGKGKKVPEMRLIRETPKVPDTPNERLVELLLARRASVDLQNADGYTALMVASGAGHERHDGSGQRAPSIVGQRANQTSRRRLVDPRAGA